MTIFKPSLLGVAALLTLGLHAIPAQATALRTFVSSTGNDANTASNCSATTPCRTLAAAFSVTQASGHIFMTDVAGYGALTITRSVTLVAIDGALIGVPSGGTGITINAGVNDDVTIDGLIIDGAGVGQNGIVFNTGKSLTVTKSVIRGMTQTGISFKPNASSALQVSNTVLAKNGFRGIEVFPTGTGTVTASLSRIEFYNNAIAGLDVNGNVSTGTINATVADSVAANNTGGGGVAFAVARATAAAANLMVIRCVIAHNSVALDAQNGATLRVGQSTVTGNLVAWREVAGGAVRSYADNNFNANNPNLNPPDPPPTTIDKQ